jgi:translocator protein
MVLKLNYIIIPLIAIFVSVFGGQLVNSGMQWYQTIKLPSLAPAGSIIGMVWSVIFILCTITALIIWNKFPRGSRFNLIIAFFLINAFLNVFWNFLFFANQWLLIGIIEMIILEITTLILIFLIWPQSKLVASLLIPYALWVPFATYLATQIFLLNR